MEAQLQKQSKLVQGVITLKRNCYQKLHSRKDLVHLNSRWLNVNIKIISELIFF